MVTSSAPRSLAWMAASIAVMPPPITTTRRPMGSRDRSFGLAQHGDEIDRIVDAFEFLALGARAR
jgi:hypothetical protein